MSFPTLLLRATETVTPFGLLTGLSGKLMDAHMGVLTQALIKCFIKSYSINLEELENKDLSSYKSFNDFFIRKLKPEARPVAQDCAAISPVDGTVGQSGDIINGRLIQAKGIDYSLRALVGGDLRDTAQFEGGGFATIYLSPANYHRIHMPIDGSLVKTIHVPGKHFPVGKRNIAGMPGLYTANERLVCLFETELGQFAVIMVGAALVGSINTCWSGTIVRRKDVEVNYYDPGQFSFKRGDEIGYFKYGSTVICMWPENTTELTAGFDRGNKVLFGQQMLI